MFDRPCPEVQGCATPCRPGPWDTEPALGTHCCEDTRGTWAAACHRQWPCRPLPRADNGGSAPGVWMDAQKSPEPIALLLSSAVSSGEQPQCPEPQPALWMLHCPELRAVTGNDSLWDLWPTAHSLYWDSTTAAAAQPGHSLHRVVAFSISNRL